MQPLITCRNLSIGKLLKNKNPTTLLQSFICFMYKIFWKFFKSVLKDCCRDHTNLVLEKQASMTRSVREEPHHPGCSLPGARAASGGTFTCRYHIKIMKHTMGAVVMKVQGNLPGESSVLLLPGASASRCVCAWKASRSLK